MCGIVGIVAAPGAAAPGRLARAMNAVITHRGPDDEGIYRDDRALLGMRRLSIIDLAGGHQPIRNEDGTCRSSSTARSTTFRELRAELEARGHRFARTGHRGHRPRATRSGATGCFARLRRHVRARDLGRAARGRCCSARDRFGEKPLFYAERRRRGSLFASELKSLLAVPGLSARRSTPAALDALPAFGYVPAPRRIFAGVAQAAARRTTCATRTGAAALQRYWDARLGRRSAARRARRRSEELARRCSTRPCASRLVADVPLGAFLSRRARLERHRRR